MKLQKPVLLGLVALALGAPMIAGAYEGNWKRGDVYYRMVCSDCHKSQPCGPIAPNSRTRAEWAEYLELANGHAKGKAGPQLGPVQAARHRCRGRAVCGPRRPRRAYLSGP